MRNIFLTFFLLLLPIINLSATVNVTSTIDGGIVRFIAPVGSIVKKDQVLVQFDTDLIEQGIKINKVKFAEAYRDLNDQALDYNRSSKLLPSHSISVVKAENDYFDYKKSELEFEHLRLELSRKKIFLTHYTIKAPRDCKVLNHYISENSGTEVGDKILQIEYIEENKKPTKNN